MVEAALTGSVHRRGFGVGVASMSSSSISLRLMVQPGDKCKHEDAPVCVAVFDYKYNCY